jgi:peptide/nickel transport system substrate-binding protein
MKSRTRAITAGVAVATSLLALTACAGATEAPTERSVTIAVTPGFGIDVHFDPFGAGGALALTYRLQNNAVYDQLIMWNENDNTWEPWLAESFEISDDGKQITFVLRDDVTFVDGQKMTAPGVAEYLTELFTDPDFSLKGKLIDLYGSEVTATDERTLVLTTSRAVNFQFWEGLMLVPILSPAAVEHPATLVEQPLGSGPYLVDKVEQEVSVSFVRNPEYWNPEAFDFDTIKLVSFDDDVAALNALKSGQVDATALSIPEALEAERSGFAVHAGASGFVGLYIQDRAGLIQPALADVRVREAIAMAFDRVAIADTIALGRASTSTQPFIPGQLEYIEGADDRYAFDPDRARSLLAEAGYPDGFDITIAASPDSSAAYQPVVVQSLADIGIRAELKTFPDGGGFYGAVQSGECPLILLYSVPTNSVKYPGTGGEALFQEDLEPEFEQLRTAFFDAGPGDEKARAQAVGEYMIDHVFYVPIVRPDVIWASIPEIDMNAGRILGFGRLSYFHSAE